MKTKTPKDLAAIQPYGSLSDKSEAETVAKNIMVILSRTGNKWRSLSFREYKKERLKDENFSSMEDMYFLRVQPYTTSARKAASFSKAWA